MNIASGARRSLMFVFNHELGVWEWVLVPDKVTPTITLVRGLPGAGKTTRAVELNRPVTVAADDYFEHDGEYRFDPKSLPQAHAWCLDQATQGLRAGHDVVVHNTFTTRWEMEPYLNLAASMGLSVGIVDEFDGGCSDEELAERNTHGVPLVTIKGMRERWEENWQDGNPTPPWER